MITLDSSQSGWADSRGFSLSQAGFPMVGSTFKEAAEQTVGRCFCHNFSFLNFKRFSSLGQCFCHNSFILKLSQVFIILTLLQVFIILTLSKVFIILTLSKVFINPFSGTGRAKQRWEQVGARSCNQITLLMIVVLLFTCSNSNDASYHYGLHTQMMVLTCKSNDDANTWR